MTRLRLTALFACLLLTAGASAQFHKTGSVGRRAWRDVQALVVYQAYEQTMCWMQGEPTGNYYKQCQVTCDSGTCWCDFSYQCYSI